MWSENHEDGLLVAFLIESIPVGDATIEHAYMDVVEVIRWVHPGTTAVVNLELKIGREVFVLHAGEVGALGIPMSCSILYEGSNVSTYQSRGPWEIVRQNFYEEISTVLNYS